MFSLKTFTMHSWENIYKKWTCLIEIWITWFQKELATPQLQIPHMKLKKYKYNPTRKILVPFRTNKVCSFTWDFAKFSFVLIIIIYLWWSSGKVLNSNAGGQSSNPLQTFFWYFNNDIVGSPGSIPGIASYLFLSSFWDYISPNDFGNIWMNFENEFWLILCQEYIHSKLFSVFTDL